MKQLLVLVSLIIGVVEGRTDTSCPINLAENVSQNAEGAFLENGYQPYRTSQAMATGLWAYSYMKCFDSWEDAQCSDYKNSTARELCRQSNNGDSVGPVCLEYVKIFRRKNNNDFAIFANKRSKIPLCKDLEETL